MTVVAGAWLALWSWAFSVALGMLALVMICRVSGGEWVAPWLPDARRVIGWIAPLTAGVIPVLLLVRALYPWAGARVAVTAEAAAQIAHARSWLSVPFFIARSIVYCSVLTWLSRRVERDASAGASAAGLVVFALTLTFASIDWLVALTPGWFSTAYGIVVFAGGFVGALGLLALRGGVAGLDQLHKLGNMLLTATLFWFYVAFCQYLVSWIGGIPRDVAYYVPRTRGPWLWVAVALVAGQFALPFLALLFVRVKRSTRALALVGGWLVAVHLLEMVWLVMPDVLGRR